MSASERRWLVREPQSLSALIARLGFGQDALSEGRVFVDRRRVHTDEALAVGVEVIIREENRAVRDTPGLLLVESGFLLLDKPAGMSVEADRGGNTTTLIAWVEAELELPANELHVHTRLDRPVSGVVLVSTSRDWRRRFEREGRVCRSYLGLCSPQPSASEGDWSAAIGRRGRQWGVGGRDARPAHTHYRRVSSAGSAAALILEPTTGRTHQLRIHASAGGCPLLGDRNHGGLRRLSDAAGRMLELERVGLHALRTTLELEGRSWTGEAKLPAELERWWRLLGGSPADLRLDSVPPP